MAGILKLFYIAIIYVSLFLVVIGGQGKLFLKKFIVDTIFQSYIVMFCYPYFTLQMAVNLTSIA
jgi:hypothetical protein